MIFAASGAPLNAILTDKWGKTVELDGRVGASAA
jgi:hypothetical protein